MIVSQNTNLATDRNAMPELPEVETTKEAIRLFIGTDMFTGIKFYRKDIREPIPRTLIKKALIGQKILRIYRRSKYIIIETKAGSTFFHLGMSGNILAKPSRTPDVNHTHAVFSITPKKHLHFVDPRRFGRIGFTKLAIDQHKYFKELGPEPLETHRLDDHLFASSRGKKKPIKTFLMDSQNVVGVGNIYASESLYKSGVNPTRPCGDVDEKTFKLIAREIKATLRRAIKAGGTTLKDFKTVDGSPGYFAIRLNVYGRDGEPCRKCSATIEAITQSGRRTFYCPQCQI